MAEIKNGDPVQQQRRRVYAAAAIMFIPFCLCMWWIFGSGTTDQETGANGPNYTVPDGKAKPIEGNKQKATERVASEQAQNQRLQTLGDDAFSLLDDGKNDEQKPTVDDPAYRAQKANREMTAQAQNFYSSPHDSEVAELRRQVEELSGQLEVQQVAQPLNPLELAEQQYKLAQKYLGGGIDADSVVKVKKRSSKKSLMQSVPKDEVSASTLNPSLDLTQERNLGFYTARESTSRMQANTIRACIADAQVVRVGSVVRLRLLEAVRIDGIFIPRNTRLYGKAQIAGMRLQVMVESVEYQGAIFDVDAVAYDLDGQPGLNVPDSKERNAIKEALATIGQSAGMSVNVTHSAGQQVVGELSRGGVTAASRYVAEKFKEVKITLKANHQLLLVSKE